MASAAPLSSTTVERNPAQMAEEVSAKRRQYRLRYEGSGGLLRCAHVDCRSIHPSPARATRSRPVHGGHLRHSPCSLAGGLWRGGDACDGTSPWVDAARRNGASRVLPRRFRSDSKRFGQRRGGFVATWISTRVGTDWALAVRACAAQDATAPDSLPLACTGRHHGGASRSSADTVRLYRAPPRGRPWSSQGDLLLSSVPTMFLPRRRDV
jgi:hypothetical protein